MNAADGCFGRIVKLRVVITMPAQLLHTFRRARAQVIEPSKDDRFGRTNFCAGWDEAALLSVVAKRALKGATGVGQRFRPAIDHAEWTGDDAISAAVTHIVLHEDRADFRPHNRAGGTRFEAAGLLAMLANI